MTIFSVNKLNYNQAIQGYNKQSQGMKNLVDNRVEDKVILGQKNDFRGGFDIILNQQKDIMNNEGAFVALSDEANSKKKQSFFDSLKAKFNSIKKSELAVEEAITFDMSMTELQATLQDANIALEECIAVRDKFVTSLKDLLNSTF
jgi:flagellar hook-basal body complex protein FliE